MRPERTGVGQEKKNPRDRTVPDKKIHGGAGVRFGPDLAPCAWTVWCSSTECNLKKKAWHKLSSPSPTLFPCFPAASDSEWPHHLAQTTVGANITPSLNASYVLPTLTWETFDAGERNHRWHCTCFREVSSLPRLQKLVMEEFTGS